MINHSFSVTSVHVSEQEHQRGFRNFDCASDDCCALSERSEFAKAVIHKRTVEKRKRKLCVPRSDIWITGYVKERTKEQLLRNDY